MRRELFLRETEGVSRALVGTGGGTCGAFSAGFLSRLGRELGSDYFDAIYASSVGVYEAMFYASNQPDTIENTWRKHIHGRQLVDMWNLSRGRSPLKLFYLTEIFQNDVSRLDTDAALQGTTPEILLTDLSSGGAVYRKPETPEDIFSLMEASCALPIHPPLSVNGMEYVDGTYSVGYPIAKALEDGHDEVLVVYNRPSGFHQTRKFKALSYLVAGQAALCGRFGLVKLALGYGKRFDEADSLARVSSDRVEIIEPERQILRSIMDTNYERLNATIDMGIRDCERWLRNRGY